MKWDCTLNAFVVNSKRRTEMENPTFGSAL